MCNTNKYTLLRYLFYLITILEYNQVFSQYPGWRNYTCVDKVFDILNDGSTIWIVTNGGLVKFDKTNETSTYYNHANAGLPDNHLRSLAIDKSENIWVSSQYYGIGKFDSESCQVYNTYNSGLPCDQWNSTIMIDPDDNKWIGALMWLVKFDNTNWEIWETGNPLSAYFSINDLKYDKNGDLWIGASWGLGKLAGDSIQTYAEITSEVFCLEVDNNNNLWIGTNDKGLIKKDNDSFQIYTSDNPSIRFDCVYDIKLDSSGNIWLTNGGRLIKFDGQDFQSFNDTLFYGGIMDFEFDTNNVIWIGSLNNGLLKYSNNTCKQFKLSSSALLSDKINDLSLDINNNIWVGTNYNLLKFDGETWYDYFVGHKSYSNPRITALNCDPSGNLWVALGQSDTCLLRIKGNDILVFNSLNSPLNSEVKINSITTDKKSNIWLATNKGLFQYNQISWQKFDTTNSALTSHRVTDLAIDKNDNLWGGTATYDYWDDNLNTSITKTGCLFKYNGEDWIIYDTSNSGLPTNNISTLAFDSKNVLWVSARAEGTPNPVGTIFGGGLTRFDGNTWITYNIDNSDLPSNTIWDIFVDHDDNVWSATCDGGLAKLEINNNWKVYNVFNSGLAVNDVSKVIADSEGNIWAAHGGNITGGISVADLNIIDNVKNTPMDNNTCGFEIFPNPANDKINILINSPPYGNFLLKINDLSGRQLYLNTIKQNNDHTLFEYSLSDLNINNNGIYLVSILFYGKIFARKMIVINIRG
jgi:ligand-binding sensor domain-containing protein